MMGSTSDPKDGAAVAGTVFSAVIVYAVRTFSSMLGLGNGGLDGYLRGCPTERCWNGEGDIFANCSHHSFSFSDAVSKPTYISATTEEAQYPYHNNQNE